MQPFVGCAGGKRVLAPIIFDLITARCPADQCRCYVEPFLGGGAVYLHLADDYLCRAVAVLADLDRHLIDLWAAVRDDPEVLLDGLTQRASQHTEAAYRSEQEQHNEGRHSPARTYYLRRGAFNALWRVNRLGRHNVPWNAGQVHVPRISHLRDIQAALHRTRAQLLDWDFRKLAAQLPLGPGTVAYVDPPYDGGYTQYTPTRFTAADQQDLLRICSRWASNGATVIYSNRATSNIRAWLKALWPGGAVHEVSNRHRISCDSSARGDVRELLVTSA